MSPVAIFFSAFALVCLSAFGAWLWHLKLKNAGVIDLVWGLNLALAAVVYAALGPGWAPRRWAIAGMVSLTGLRAHAHTLATLAGSSSESGRVFSYQCCRF